MARDIVLLKTHSQLFEIKIVSGIPRFYLLNPVKQEKRRQSVNTCDKIPSSLALRRYYPTCSSDFPVKNDRGSAQP